jgi:N-acetylglutamate synthase-like GNAT family acetyltransferase
MHQEIKIRRATPDDASAIEALYRELVNNPAIYVSPQRLEQVARGEHTFLLVAVCDGAVAGTALLSLCLDVMFGNQTFGVIENVVVSGDARSAGIGAMLMLEIERIATTNQCSKLMLLSTASRTDAHRFFARHGFQDSSKRGFVKYRRDFNLAT